MTRGPKVKKEYSDFNGRHSKIFGRRPGAKETQGSEKKERKGRKGSFTSGENKGEEKLVPFLEQNKGQRKKRGKKNQVLELTCKASNEEYTSVRRKTKGERESHVFYKAN